MFEVAHKIYVCALSVSGVRKLNRPPVYPSGRRGNNSCPHAKIATASPSLGRAREARHSLRGGSRGSVCVGARIVAMATAWVHRGRFN